MSEEKRYPRRWKFQNSGYVLQVDKPGGKAMWIETADTEEADALLDEAQIDKDSVGDDSFCETFDHHTPTPDHAELVARLAAAAEEAVIAFDKACRFDNSISIAEHVAVYQRLTAALAQLPPELRGKP